MISTVPASDAALRLELREERVEPFDLPRSLSLGKDDGAQPRPHAGDAVRLDLVVVDTQGGLGAAALHQRDCLAYGGARCGLLFGATESSRSSTTTSAECRHAPSTKRRTFTGVNSIERRTGGMG